MPGGTQNALKVPKPLIRFLRKYLRPQVVGPHVDFIRGTLLMQDFLREHVTKRALESEFGDFFYDEDELLDMPPNDRLLTVYEHLEYQVRDLLVHMHDTDNHQKAANPICSATAKPYHFQYPGFSLRKIQHTTGPQGGEGVFVEGCIQAGQLVGFYPGLVFQDHESWLLSYGTDEVEDYYDTNLMRRHDGYVIDGATNIGAWGATVEGQYCLSHPDLANSQDCGTLPNAYAQMQYVPHPPKNKEPNVFQLPFDIEKNILHDDLIPYVPNQFFPEKEKLQKVQIDPRLGTWDPNIMMKCLVFVASRRIENEELFLDYRMDPDAPSPDWYYVIDEKALRVRHNKNGIGGRLRSWWRRRNASRWEVYKEVMAERRNKGLDDLPEALGGAVKSKPWS